MQGHTPSKRILFDDKATAKIDKGIAIAADAIGLTMGPKGWNVMFRTTGLGSGKVVLTKDGVSVANELSHPDPEVDMGIAVAVEASQKTNDAAGDGTTCTVVLLDAMLREARKQLKNGSNPIRVQQGMNEEMKMTLEALGQISKPVDTEEDIFNVAYVSCQDADIAKKISGIILEVGKYGSVSVESKTGPYNIDLRIERGMHFPFGYEPRLTHMSAASVVGQMQRSGGDARKLSWDNDEVGILMFDEPVKKWQDIEHIFSACVEAGRTKLLLIGDFDDDAAVGIQAQMQQNVLTAATINRSLFGGEVGRETLKDIAIYTGATLLSPSDATLPPRHQPVENVASILGSCTANVFSTSFSLTSGAGGDDSVENRVALIEQELEEAGLDDYHKQRYRERIARFKAGIGTITIFAPTEVQQKSLQTRVDDAVCAVRSANEEGITPGGGVALLRCHQFLSREDRGHAYTDPDMAAGAAIVRAALLQPARQIAEVAGEDAGVRLAQLKAHDWKSPVGYNYWTEEEANLFEVGIIDPKKVVRMCVENAVSVVSEVLRVRVSIAELPAEETDDSYLDPRQRAERVHKQRAQQG